MELACRDALRVRRDVTSDVGGLDVFGSKMLRQENNVGMRELSRNTWNNSFGPAQPKTATTALAA